MARRLNSPHLVRGRLRALRRLLAQASDPLEQALLRSGHFPDAQGGEVAMAQEAMALERDPAARAPLTFTELSSLSSWFYLHPEKVCGEERATRFSKFPLEVVGKRGDVERAIRLTPSPPLSDLERLAQETERILSQL